MTALLLSCIIFTAVEVIGAIAIVMLIDWAGRKE